MSIAPLNIPCYLTVYNQLTWPRAMAEQCVRLGLTPIILDNGSTYPPLIKWYLTECPYEVRYVGRNEGCYGFYRRKEHHKESGLYVLSDSDLDLSGVPDDAVARLKDLLDKEVELAKVGLSLALHDIPEHHQFRDKVIAHELKWWDRQNRYDLYWKDGTYYLGQIGATFALYDPKRNNTLDDWPNGFYKSARLGPPYTARHLPWYLDLTKLDAEMEYYFYSCDNVAHWGSTYKNWLQEYNREAGVSLPNV